MTAIACPRCGSWARRYTADTCWCRACGEVLATFPHIPDPERTDR